MITTTYTSEEWQAYAECAAPTINNDIFFSEEIHEIATAKSICLNCSVISPCLQGAIERNEPCGVWGGQHDDALLLVLVLIVHIFKSSHRHLLP